MSFVKHGGANAVQRDKVFEEAIILPAAGIVVCLQLEWLRRVTRHVPEPYLDEIFHIPQADTYWQGKWSQWDDKITTPPGTYVYSILLSKIAWFDGETSTTLTPFQLRVTNTILLYLLATTCTIWLWLAGRRSFTKALGQTLAIFSFPLFFFFSGLYYTDLFSAFTVMITYCCWLASSRQPRGLNRFLFQTLYLFCGLIALTARQTNIFWVAVFMGGLQAVATVKAISRIHDPSVADAYFEDFPTAIISLITSAFGTIPDLLIDLWPQFTLLGSFAAFVAWNGGVVLGDKSNHVPGIHLPQMLYLWPFIMFFSWPLVLPQFVDFKLLQTRIPRPWLMGVLLMLMLGMVQFNTIVHPFLLADNRHYTFYAFKALRAAPWKWYAAVPVYALCAWFAGLALGSKRTYSGGPGVKGSKSRRLSTASGKGDVKSREGDASRISFLLVWLVSTALSLVTAPLVEHRYFIIPWLIWRLHVPDADDVLPAEEDSQNYSFDAQYIIRKALRLAAEYSVWIEVVWYMAVNAVAGYLFLYRGFEWPQEPGKVQRFMW